MDEHLENPVKHEKIWQLLAMIQDGENDFPRLLGAAQDIFEATGASLFLEKEVKGVYELAAATGGSQSIPADTVVRESEGLAGHSIREKRPLLVGDPSNIKAAKATHFKHRQDIGSSMVVPLILPNHTAVGVINFARSHMQGEFTEVDLERAASVASNLALIFENARLVNNLKQSHVMLSQVLQSFDIGVCLFDPRQRLFAFNEPAKAWLSSHPENWETFLQSLPSDLSMLAKIGSVSITGMDSNGKPYWQSECEFGDQFLRFNLVKLAGGGIGWTVQNLTDHVKTQREAGRLQRLAEIGQMTATVAHEIRNPLTSISGAAHMIQECPDKAIDFAKIIEEESLKLGELCHEFLDFSKPLRLNKEAVDTKGMLAHLKDLHQKEASNKSVEVTVVGRDDLPAIQGDKLRIEQVARNLLLNAIQACSEGGKVELVAEEHGFKVLDNGSGVSNEFMDRLFSPFATTKVNGTGLGLCNVKKIVDAHGGAIMVEQLNPGTTFKVRFPEIAA